MAQTAIDGRNIYFSDGLIASAAAPALTSRAHRWVNIPDQEVELYLYLWSFNGTTNPASGTTWTVGFVSIEDTVNFPVYIAGSRPNGTSNPLPVVQTVAGPTQPVSGTVTATVTGATVAAGTAAIGDVGVQYRANATGAASRSHLVSAASTNATVAKASAGRLLGWHVSNTNAAYRYVKLHNTASAPTAGTGVVQTIAVPPNGVASFQMSGGIGFATGIAFTTVTGSADADSAAVAAGDLIIDLFFA